MRDEKVKSLSEFISVVSQTRRLWKVDQKKELWFRGERKRHETVLRPKLYRPKKDKPMKPISELLEMENLLYDEFERCGHQLCQEKLEEEDRYWDWYFLMQHHGTPTRLLDWSDGALIALHFALQNKQKGDSDDAYVYVLEPYRMRDQINALPEIEMAEQSWGRYIEKHPFHKSREDEWEYAYLPSDEEDLKELPIPKVPLPLHFPHITRRVAAQRSRFMVFGTDPFWLSAALEKGDAPLKEIAIEARCVPEIKIELRDNGVTESVIFPDLDGLGREMNQLFEAWK